MAKLLPNGRIQMNDGRILDPGDPKRLAEIKRMLPPKFWKSLEEAGRKFLQNARKAQNP